MEATAEEVGAVEAAAEGGSSTSSSNCSFITHSSELPSSSSASSSIDSFATQRNNWVESAIRIPGSCRRFRVRTPANAESTTTGELAIRLCAADPNFDAQAFYQRVGVAFRKIQAAWCAQNLSTVRPFISDGVHERFSLQVAEQRAEGYRDQMDNIYIHDIDLLELHSDGLFDELSVRIEASAADYRVSLANGKRVSGSTAPERFVEVWTFLRHRGAVTQPGKAGLIEGNCPNCGAAVELNQAANCTHCKALLRSGQYDWVLSEITQEIEWHGERHGELPGVATLRSRDPEFNAVELEDRASVMFWRKATADRVGKIDPLRKAASEAFCQAYEPLLKPGPDGRRQSYAECAVGSVCLMGVIPDLAQGTRPSLKCAGPEIA